MYDAGAIVFNIRAAGAALFRQDMTEAEKAAERLGRTVDTAASKTEQLGSKQETAGQKARRLAQEQAAAEKAAREYADAQEHVGKVLVTAGAAVVATTGLTVKAAMDWQSAWAGVTKTVEGTPEELAAVEQGLRDLTGVLPASHDEIAAVAEAAGQLGVKTQDVVGFTRTMVDLGETTNLTSDQAATALAQLMNIMGTAGEDVDRLGSTIVALGNDGASTEAEIVTMAQRIAGSGKLVGATEGEVLALANALASMGVTAELGGGVASRVLQDLYSAVQTGGDKLAGFADVAGVSASEFAAAFRDDPVRAMGAFATGLNGVEASGGNVVQTLNDLGFKSTEEQRILLQLKSSGDLLTDSLELQNTAWQENSALSQEAAKRYETVESQLGIMRNRITDAAIDLGSVFLPVIAEVADAVGDFASGIASLPAPLQEAIAVGGLLIGAITLVGGTAMIAVPKVASLWGQIQLLTASGTRAGSALRGVAGFLGGPWGVALVAATAVMVAYNNAMEAGIPAQEDVTNAILSTAAASDKLGGAIQKNQFFPQVDDSTRELLEDLPSLLEQSAEAADNWVVGLAKSSTASDNAFDAIDRYGEGLAALAATNMPAAAKGFRELVDEQNLTDEQAEELLRKMPKLREALLGLANGNGEAATETDLLNMLLEESAEVSQSAARGYIDAADGASQLEGELQELLDLLNEANNVGQDAITTNIDYQNALADVDETIKNARDGVEGYAITLDQGTQAGRDNMSMLVGLAQDAWNAAEAQYALDGNTDAYRQRLEDSRQALLDRINELGLSGDAAEALADQIMQIPSETEWKVIAETAQAQVAIDNFVNRNGQKTINVWVNPRVQSMNDAFAGYLNSKGFKNADGNVVRYFANGGVEHHVAQIARAGDVRIWAEDETGGESYIPHAPSKRARSEQIMAETARILGGTYIPGDARAFANGSPVTGGGAETSPVVALLERIAAKLNRPNVTLVNPVTRDPMQDAWEAAQIGGPDV
ncbi:MULTISPECIES: phage tail tape measure protein [Microbacterium]|uniref:phage tail tape measure protein n=1 Tax=Microbacterium TaxID=33882 RepID=UPI001C2B864F|nr:phage tail tape measure protein [Microbacterium paraoxydans]QXE28949.1 phage tail tape measure protein [Microbacterium paraoxydans]